jgi:predicted MFS family arabinose efflux permease
VLFVNVPIGLMLALAAPYVLPESEKKKGGTFDLPGAIISTAGVSALVYGFIHAASTSWGNTTTIAAFVVAAVLLIAFVVVESRTEDPLMPLRLFRDRNRTGSYVVMLATAASLFSMFFFLTQYVQEVLGYSALKAGFAFLPVTGMIVVSAQIASKAVAKTGPRPLITIGAVLLAGGLLWLATITPQSTYLGTLLPTMLITAAGLGLIFVPITLTAVAGVAQTDAGIASAMLNVTQQIGGTIGLSALVTVFAAAFKSDLAAQTARLPGTPTRAETGQITVHALAHGWARGFLVASLFALVALVANLLAIRVEPSDVPAGQPAPAG